MELSEEHRRAFDEDGFALIRDVFTRQELDAAEAAVEHLYTTGQKNDGIVSYVSEPGLYFLFQDERLERIARHMLRAESVVLTGTASLYKRPTPGATEWAPEGEHVDVMYSLDEFNAQPKQMMIVLIVFVSDVPEGRGNTLIRPGTHRMVAHHLAATGTEPIKAQPTHLRDLPDLDWPPLQPVIGTRGHVLATTTSLIHCGSTNITGEPRRQLFVNYCPRGMLKATCPNHDHRATRTVYRRMLHDAFAPERRHLLLDSED